MVVSVTASTTQGKPLNKEELGKNQTNPLKELRIFLKNY